MAVGTDTTEVYTGGLSRVSQKVDAAYQRALQLGATSLDEPSDKPYQDRGAGFKDTFGSTWWIGTYIGAK